MKEVEIIAFVCDVKQWASIDKVRKERKVLKEYINVSPYQEEQPKGLIGINTPPAFGIIVTAVFEVEKKIIT